MTDDHDDTLLLMRSESTLLGALIGWKFIRTQNGAALRLQTARSVDEAKRPALNDVVLTTTQLRQLALSLEKIADHRDGKTRTEKKNWLW